MSDLGSIIDSMWNDSGDSGTGNSNSGCFWFIVLLIGGFVIAYLGCNNMLPW